MALPLVLLLVVTVTAFSPRDGDRDSERISMCYDDLGCINTDLSWFNPVYRPINLLPQSRNEINTRFFLYTRAQSDGILVTPSSIIGSAFQASRPTKIVVHGFANDGTTPWVVEMATNLLIHGDYNVIVVDWGGGASLPLTQATANIRLVALEIAFLVRTLVDQASVDVADIHLIGHSLGAHGSGYVGNKISGIGRITGLDPAGPYFRGMPDHVKLDASDAAFVDIIHTMGKPSLGRSLGNEEAVGHLDFYPNGGEKQPGCGFELEQDTISYEIFATVGCSHSRAYELFSDSLVSSCSTVSYECESYESFEKGECTACGADNLKCAILGIDAVNYPSRSRTSVRLFSYTASSAPFCQSQWRVSVSLANPFLAREVYGSVDIKLVADGITIEQTATRAFPMAHGQTHQFIIDGTTDVQSVQEISLSWRNRWNPILFSTYCIFFCNNSLHVEKVRVNTLTSSPGSSRLSSEANFCPGNGEQYVRLRPKRSYTFRRTC